MFARKHLCQHLLANSRDFRFSDLTLLPTLSFYQHKRMTSAGPPPMSPPKPGSFSDHYDKFISQWPKVHALHRMVVDGSRWCFSDIKAYIRIKRELASKKKTIADLNMAELEVLVQPTSVEGIHLPNLEQLSADVLMALSAIHSMYPLPGVRRRFQLRCKALRQLDRIVDRNLSSLTARQLHFHLFIRRINNTGSSEDEMRRILKSWLKFTKKLDDVAYLCAPVFFNKGT